MSEKYNKFKNYIINKYNSPFNPVFWVKNRYADVIVWGISKDIIYKIITPTDDKKKIILFWREKVAFSNVNRKIIFIYPNKDFTKIQKEEEIDL